MNKIDRKGRLDGEMDVNHDESMEDCVQIVGVTDSSKQMRPVIVSPLADFHPKIGLIDMESKSPKEANAVGKSVENLQTDRQILGMDPSLSLAEDQVILDG
jgi:hypothetical protein